MTIRIGRGERPVDLGRCEGQEDRRCLCTLILRTYYSECLKTVVGWSSHWVQYQSSDVDVCTSTTRYLMQLSTRQQQRN